ncbi:MAG TPA: protease complex subunit PrcB family protein [Fontimonas sp.]
MNMMRKGGWTKRLGLLAAVALLPACGISRWFGDGGDAVSVAEVARAQLCTAEDETSRVTLFRSALEAQEWQQRTGIELRLTDELKAGRYALIEMGQRHTAGHGIAVSREAREVAGNLQIYTTYFAPAADAMAAQMISSPCVLVRLPNALYGAVEVYDQDGELRATGVTTAPTVFGG